MKRVLAKVLWPFFGAEYAPLVWAGVVLLGAFGFLIVCFHMESKTYNKLTGAHTTWWDAAWVELRVQGDTK